MDANQIDRLFDEVVGIYDSGDLMEAERRCHNLCNVYPTYAPAVGLMGVILCQTGRGEIGIQFIEKATELAPDEATLFNNLGTGYTGLERLEEALSAFDRAIELAPNNAQAHNNIGAVLRPLGRLNEACLHYAKAVEITPKSGHIWANYANVLMDLDRVEEADAAAQTAVNLSPNYAVAHNNLGTVRQRRGQYSEAEDHFRRALDLNDDYADAHANIAEVLKDTGRIKDALPHYERARELAPAEAAMGSNHMLALCAVDGLNPTEIAAAHAAWGGAHAKTPQATHAKAPQVLRVNRRLRVGYVSPDFRRHSVAYFLEPLFEHHDSEAVEVFAYANMPTDGDAVTKRLRGRADQWRNVFALDDQTFCDQVRADQIDILIDLAGHTRGNRLTAFAHRPAPMQMSYLGYPATTGLDAVDFRLTDARADPPGMTEAFHCEALLRLDGGFLCYRPDDDAPDVATLPAHRGNGITFGSFNNLAKVNATVIETWAAILDTVPGSRLILKAKALRDDATAARLTESFARHGIDPTRIECLSWIVDGSPLAAYHRVDIALDTFPYNGTTTTCEAQWMGVPTVTLAGDWHAARVGVSLMTKLGLDDWIAPNLNAYVKLAAEKADKLGALADIRSGLRNRMTDQGLTDGARFVRNLEAAYQKAWDKEDM